jgi:hypothetical protein
MRKPGKASIRAARNERLSTALRENLKRRKAQVRGRATASAPENDTAEAGVQREAEGPDFRRNRGNE